MRDKLNQFISNLNGQFVEVSDKTNIYQCMDLAYLWVFCLGFPKATIQKLYASDVYTNFNDLANQYFNLIPNTPDAIPQDGDLIVWKGTIGHIAIGLSGGNTKTFMCFEQNNPLGTNAHIQSHDYTNVLGFLRPKYKVEITDQTILPIIDSQGHFYEVQAIRSKLIDYEQQITNLLTDKDNFIKEIVDLKLTLTGLNTKITDLETKLNQCMLNSMPMTPPDAPQSVPTPKTMIDSLIEWLKGLFAPKK